MSSCFTPLSIITPYNLPALQTFLQQFQGGKKLKNEKRKLRRKVFFSGEAKNTFTTNFSDFLGLTI